MKKSGKILKNKDSVLVIYYSLDGYTKLVAETIAKGINADILELKPERELLKVSGIARFSKYLWGGRQVIMKETPILLPFEKNIDDYGLLIIGTPVWAFTFAPPLRTFFSNVKMKGKKIALFCTHEGTKGKTLENMRKELLGNEIIGEIDFRRPKKSLDEDKAKIISFAKDLLLKLFTDLRHF